MSFLKNQNVTGSNSLQQLERSHARGIQCLNKKNTCTLTDLPNHKNLIGCKWTFRLKKKPDGSISKYKARIIAKGYSQQCGFDFTGTFSPVVKPSLSRIILTIALYKDQAIKQLDVNNAFLNGVLQEEVFMAQTEGFVQKEKENLVYKLNTAIYGLKQAPGVWFDMLKATLSRHGYSQIKQLNIQKIYQRYCDLYTD